MAYYSAMKIDLVMHAVALMDIRRVVLSEKSPSQKFIYCMILFHNILEIAPL